LEKEKYKNWKGKEEKRKGENEELEIYNLCESVCGTPDVIILEIIMNWNDGYRIIHKSPCTYNKL
jgi:hypothetical protein